MNLKVFIKRLQDFYILAIVAPASAFRRPYYVGETIAQMDYVGVGSLFIVFLVSLFIGMAVSIQIAAQLSTLGLNMYTGKIVGMTIITEVGPVAIALTFAGRVGSGMASELGSMVLGHQVDTLRVLGVNPIKKLVTPRIVSAVIMLPVLTIIGDAVSLLGGYYVAAIGHSGSFYWSQIKGLIDFERVFSALVKPFIFGYLIATISCYLGLSTHTGAKGLRKTTTTAVVISTIMIILMDFVLTTVLLYVFGKSL